MAEEIEKTQEIPGDPASNLEIAVLTAAVVGEYTIDHTVKEGNRVWNKIRNMPPRVRGVTLLMFSVATLLVLVYVLFLFYKEYVHDHTGPFLQEALAAPYEMNERTLPDWAEGQTGTILPEAFGTNRYSTPEIEHYSMHVLNRCLVGVPVDWGTQAYCDRSQGAVLVEKARYMDKSNSPVDVIAVRFTDVAAAQTTHLELLRYARKSGQVGNFSVDGTTANDYFYASTYSDVARWYSYSWRRDEWVFTISTQDSLKLDEKIKAFPY
ncbi:MAG TPA: hypothetical protein VHP83_02910 [Aggregatilineaceae bacterium]|nr:hypothetical protein [Aggregatilineaceae bacterium]